MQLTDFGHTIAGIKTAQILNDLKNPQLQRKLTRSFQEFCIGLKELGRLENRMVFESFWGHWKNTWVQKVERDEKIPEKLKHHFSNTLVGMARDTRRWYIIQKGWEGQKRKHQLEDELVKHRIDFEEALKEAQ